MYSVYLTDYNATPNEYQETITKEKLYIYDQLNHDEALMITEPILNLEASKAGSFSFNMPQTNIGYNKIIRGLTRVVVEKDDHIIFMGRILESDNDIWMNTKVAVDGALTYLNDSISEKKIFTNKNVYEITKDILDHHNTKFPNEPWKQFNVITDIPNDKKAKFVGRDVNNASSNNISSYSINYDNPLELLQELVGLADGAFTYKYNETSGQWDVYIYDKFKFPVISQPIEFGLNLLDLTQNYNNSSICTVVAPFGGDLVQESKEIGDIVAGYTGEHPEDIYNNILIRGENDYDYFVNDVSQDPDYMNSGYWAFTFDIAGYNNAHPNNPIKKLYVSWRAYRFVTRNNYVADNAWRIISRVEGLEQSLGFHELTDGAGFESEINEEIDLTDPKYYRATHIMMGGWGGLIKPIIRRDATIVEENDRLTIEKCAAFEDELYEYKHLTHEAGSLYLSCKELVDKFGRIEKKIEYSIEDSLIPIANWVLPYQGALGDMASHDNTALGYDVGNVGDEPDLNINKGDYKIIPFYSAYSCIEYELPDLDDPNRPRGVFITSRMHEYGIHEWNGKQWRINGMCVFLDTSQQVLTYQSAAEPDKGVGFTNLRRQYIDLSDPKYYGTKYIRIGGYIGDGYGLELVPSDDKIAQNRLLAQAKLYLTQYQWEKCVIEATAVDLNITDNDWEALEVCTNTYVISDSHNMNPSYFPITSLSIQLDDFSQNKVILGYDNEEYITTQLSQEARVLSVTKSIEERRTKQ